MPDLCVLLADEARRLEPDVVPGFDDLVVRARRRRARRGLAAGSGAVAAVLAVGLGGLWLLPRGSAPVTVAAPPSPSLSLSATVAAPPSAVGPEAEKALLGLAMAMAGQNGDPTPTRIEVVRVEASRPVASRQPTATSAPLVGGYVVEVQGTFVCSYCKGKGELRGTVTSEQVSLGFVVTGRSFGGPWQDLSRYGTPLALAVPVADPTASAVATTSKSAVSGSASPAARPTSLAEAETRALSAALNPGTAHIAWSLATTAKALRLAGESMPAAVPDATPMFVIAVHGDAMTDGSPSTKASLVHRFGVIWRGDGSAQGLGDASSLGSYFTRLEPPTLPQATVVPLASIENVMSGYTQAVATALADAIPVQVAVAAAGPKPGDTVHAALVQTNETDGLHPLAWVVELNPQPASTGTLWSQTVVDAATGVAFASVVP